MRRNFADRTPNSSHNNESLFHWPLFGCSFSKWKKMFFFQICLTVCLSFASIITFDRQNILSFVFTESSSAVRILSASLMQSSNSEFLHSVGGVLETNELDIFGQNLESVWENEKNYNCAGKIESVDRFMYTWSWNQFIVINMEGCGVRVWQCQMNLKWTNFKWFRMIINSFSARLISSGITRMLPLPTTYVIGQ